MKRKLTCVLLLSVCVLFLICGCQKNDVPNQTAVYEEDTTLGEGNTVFTLDVTTLSPQKTVSFTIHTDETLLSDALLENNLIQGRKDTQGLYLITVNGTEVDYNETKQYWAFYEDDQYAMQGVDKTEIVNNAHYALKVEVVE